MPDILTNEEKYRWILSHHLPAEAVDWVYNYLNLHKVHFHITRERRSKLGDYRWPQGVEHPFHEISVNGDLNPWFFLWVFLHEAAHLETHLKYKGVVPHGHEWQEEYRQLLKQHANLFPPEVQALLARYTRRVPLSRPVANELEAALRRHDPDYNPDTQTLDDLCPGDRFRLKSKPAILFQADERRRTRWICTDLATGRRYLVNGGAEVVVAE